MTAQQGERFTEPAITSDEPLVREQPIRHCQECAAAFRASRDDQVFCRDVCRSRWHNRRASRAMTLYGLAMAWRKRRTKGTLSEMSQVVDGWLAEDRKAGRI